MGKIKTESHFSHPHPLTLISSDDDDQQTPNPFSFSSCSGCSLKPTGMIYACTICPTTTNTNTNYFLHQKCFEMPIKITHPFHKKHALTLLPLPAYPTGGFNCDACGLRGTAFSYHCKPCSIDLHILCAATPLSLTSPCHKHKLDLTFQSPYETKKFVCDVCRGRSGGGGFDHWLYRCGACEFDVHLKCATAAPRRDDHATSSRSAPQPQPQGGQYFPAAAAAMHPMMQGNAAFGVPAMGVGMGNTNLAFQAAVAQMIQNNSAGGINLGGYGGDPRGLQQMMQMVTALNRLAGGGMDMFGGGGIPGLDMLGGGGLETLFGGGALDFLGGGGLDFLGGLGGLL